MPAPGGPTAAVPDKVAKPTGPQPAVAAKGPEANPGKRQRPWKIPTGVSPAGANPRSAAVSAAASRPQPAPAAAGTPAGDVPDQHTEQQPAATTVNTFSVPQTNSVVTQTAPVAATAQMTAPTTTTTTGPVSRVVDNTLAWAGVSPSPTDSPVTPVDSPAMLAVLAGWRRQSQQALAGEKATNLADLPQTSQTVDPMVTGDQALADPSITALSAPVTVNEADVTAASPASAQVKPATPQTQQSGRARPGGDTTAPNVSVTAPAAGATVSGTVPVSATATDNVGVVGVQFKLDGTNLGAEDTTRDPTTLDYGVSWNTTTVANGSHTLTAVARDAAGNATTTPTRTVTVNNDRTSPNVSVTAPAAGATVSGTVPVSATATDNVGVVGVQFKLDGTNLGAADTTRDPTTLDYGVSWNTTTVANGSHTLTAVARDAAGNTKTSTAVPVTVANEPPAATNEPITVGPLPTTVAVSGPRVYVLNSGDNTISVINTNTNQVIATSGPLGNNFAVSPDGARLYVVNGNSNSVSIVDANTLTPVGASIPVGSSPSDIAVSPNGRYVHVANAGDGEFTAGSVSIIDTSTNTVVADLVTGSGVISTIPFALAVNPDSSKVYVANAGEGTVSVIDTATKQVVGDPIFLGGEPFDVALSPDGRRVYVANNGDGTVSVIDTTTDQVVDTITVGAGDTRSGPYTVAVSPDGRQLYVGRNDDTVWVVDTTTNEVTGAFIDDTPSGIIRSIAVSADGSRLYASDGNENKVLVLTPGDAMAV